MSEMTGDVSLRIKYRDGILNQIKKEKNISNNDFRLIANRLSRANFDELERTYEAFERFGVNTIFDIIKN